MTGNYNLLVPSMLVCIVSFALCRNFTLYEKQLSSRLDAPSKLGNMASAILRRLTVRQALIHDQAGDLVLVPRDMSLAELMAYFATSTQACFPVIDNERLLTGVVDARDIRRVITETGMGDLIIARDIEIQAPTVTPRDSLLSAINHMVKTDRDELAVVDEKNPRQVVGTLNRSDIIAAYNRQIVGAM
jgi:CIC family chloride channel protein